MHRTNLYIVCLVLMIFGAGCGGQDLQARDATALARTPTLNQNRLATYRIDVSTLGHGSGVALSHDGYILTNDHVVRESPFLTVNIWNATTMSWETVPVSIKYRNSELDLAVVKVEHRLDHVVTVGMPIDTNVGDLIYNIGYSFDLGEVVTRGYVMQLGFYESDDDMTIRNNILADLNNGPGSSGSGVFLERTGELMGLMRFISFQGMSSGTVVMKLSGAVPVSQIRSFLDEHKVPYYGKDGLRNGAALACTPKDGSTPTPSQKDAPTEPAAEEMPPSLPKAAPRKDWQRRYLDEDKPRGAKGRPGRKVP